MSINSETFQFEDYPTDNDLLGFRKAADSLARMIDASDLPLSLGLFGRWGAGKSSYLRMLENALCSKPTANNHRRVYFAAHFEPWKLNTSDAVLYDLISALHLAADTAGALSIDSGSNEAKEMFLNLEDLELSTAGGLARSGVVGIAENQLGIGRTASALANRFWSDPKAKAEKRVKATARLPSAYQAYVNSMTKVPVIVIDDLDRCSPETVVRVLESLQLYLQERTTRSIYVLAMDHEMVTKAVCRTYGFEHWEDGWQFLSKICNVTYYVPRPRIRGIIDEFVRRSRRKGLLSILVISSPKARRTAPLRLRLVPPAAAQANSPRTTHGAFSSRSRLGPRDRPSCRRRAEFRKDFLRFAGCQELCFPTFAWGIYATGGVSQSCTLS